jgi:SOS-response transcriptional repressor LexA
MNEQNQNIRPTKKQRELLGFIEQFIGEHGYSPSYREIMVGCNYTSVATVSLHVNNLIKRGHLVKREHNARSIEVVKPTGATSEIRTNQVSPNEEKWFVEKVDHFFAEAEQSSLQESATVEKLQTLVAALQVLGLDGAAQHYLPRLNSLRERSLEPEAVLNG